jgi:DNA-binding GntR family transcriptional regulator
VRLPTGERCLRAKVRWIRRSNDRSTPRFQEALTEIKSIYRALVARDTKAAADAMHVHIKNAYKFGRAR